MRWAQPSTWLVILPWQTMAVDQARKVCFVVHPFNLGNPCSRLTRLGSIRLTLYLIDRIQQSGRRTQCTLIHSRGPIRRYCGCRAVWRLGRNRIRTQRRWLSIYHRQWKDRLCRHRKRDVQHYLRRSRRDRSYLWCLCQGGHEEVPSEGS